MASIAASQKGNSKRDVGTTLILTFFSQLLSSFIDFRTLLFHFILTGSADACATFNKINASSAVNQIIVKMTFESAAYDNSIDQQLK